MEKQSVPQNRHKGWSIDDVDAFCRDFLEKLQLDLQYECKKEEDFIKINVNGNDRPMLLSNSAALLNNMEYLLNKIFPGAREEAPIISMDSDSYRRYRELELKLLAEMAAKKVLSGKKPLSLQPMIPRERRIIHLAVATIEGVQSKSEGEGEHRSITIYPAE